MTRTRTNGLPFNPGAPFTRKQALEAGIADAALRGPDYQQVFWGLYILSRITLTLAVRSLAALMVSPAGAVSATRPQLDCGEEPRQRPGTST